MAVTPSSMLPLGTDLPACTLPDVRFAPKPQMIDIPLFAQDQPLLVAFICNHCPFVLHIIKPWVAMMSAYQKQGLACVAISSNDPISYPADAPDQMTTFAKENNFTFPYCHDATQSVAKAFHAACTPDFFLFDANHHLVYRGRFDDATPGNKKQVNGKDLSEAIEALLAGKPAAETQMPSMGCNIKWASDADKP
jgi:hypothetical protein